VDEPIPRAIVYININGRGIIDAQKKGTRVSRRSKKNPGSNMDNVEGALERAIERPFSRLFRSPLQPAEIEKAAVKEVEKTRKLGVNTIYVANVYTVAISPKDEVTLGDLIETLESDLATRLHAYASNNNYLMSTRPIVTFVVDDSFKLGEVYVIGETLSEETILEEFGPDALPAVPKKNSPRAQVEQPSYTANHPNRGLSVDPYLNNTFGVGGEQGMIPAVPRSSTFAPTGSLNNNVLVGGSTDDETALVSSLAVPHGTTATIAVNSQPPFVLGGQDSYVNSRKGLCDILIEDPQASRQHAEIVREGLGWAIADLDSTNGTLLNEQPVTHRRLKDGDVVTVGATTITYRETER